MEGQFGTTRPKNTMPQFQDDFWPKPAQIPPPAMGGAVESSTDRTDSEHWIEDDRRLEANDSEGWCLPVGTPMADRWETTERRGDWTPNSKFRDKIVFSQILVYLLPGQYLVQVSGDLGISGSSYEPQDKKHADQKRLNGPPKASSQEGGHGSNRLLMRLTRMLL